MIFELNYSISAYSVPLKNLQRRYAYDSLIDASSSPRRLAYALVCLLNRGPEICGLVFLAVCAC